MERRISATDARIHFGELMRRVVENQEPVIVERSGEPHVVVISVDQYERLMAAHEEQDDWRELVSQARAQVRADLGDRELTPPEEVLAEIREERDEQLAPLR
ncbi:MAG: type II toxin-antitoxin system Phd/YefM family antitoxin [Chloroflexota bacterium]|nr:type II toxin-antitoxin system Phd/YefM family antitoxin [Chloroflexota bacterium]